MSENEAEVTEEMVPESSDTVVVTDVMSSDYPVSTLRKPESIADIGKEVMGVHHVYGFDTARRGNLHFIEDDRIISVAGSFIVFENIHTGAKEFLTSISETGIGCVAVHPSRAYFAVGGRGYQPSIYIYSYPDLKVLFFPIFS